MVVLSKILCGSSKYQIVSPLPSVSFNDGLTEQQQQHRCHADATSLPLDEPVLDFGAVPNLTGDSDALQELANLTSNSRLTLDQSALRRRLIVGSRTVREPGERFYGLELFNGVLSDEDPRNRIDGDAATRAALPSSSTSSSISKTTSAASNNSSSASRSAAASVCPVIPTDTWPTTAVCLPCIGNLHRIEACSDFVLLFDIISPSYRNPSARQCRYSYQIDGGGTSRETESSRLLASRGLFAEREPQQRLYCCTRKAKSGSRSCVKDEKGVIEGCSAASYSVGRQLFCGYPLVKLVALSEEEEESVTPKSFLTFHLKNQTQETESNWYSEV